MSSLHPHVPLIDFLTTLRTNTNLSHFQLNHLPHFQPSITKRTKFSIYFSLLNKFSFLHIKSSLPSVYFIIFTIIVYNSYFFNTFLVFSFCFLPFIIARFLTLFVMNFQNSIFFTTIAIIFINYIWSLILIHLSILTSQNGLYHQQSKM